MRLSSAQSARRHASRLVLLLVTLLGAGCTQFIENQVIEAPNKGRHFDPRSDPSEFVQRLIGVDNQFRVDVGPPDASLLVWGIEPDLKDVGSDQAKGTILVLHGIHNEMSSMLGKGHDLARAGYRVFLVDLRGNGRSTGDWLTYGVRESQDLVQVIDAIDQRGQLDGDLGVWGLSYGAATAIQLAGRDPRVKAVVAVAPFSSMRSAVPAYTHTVLPPFAWFNDEAKFNALIDRASTRAGFDPDDADTAAAAARSQAQILLLHGKWDALVPIENSETILAADSGRAQLERLPGLGHVTIYFDVGSVVKKRSIAWFDRWLGSAEPAPDGGSVPIPLRLPESPHEANITCCTAAGAEWVPRRR